jgi:hypothetical protein
MTGVQIPVGALQSSFLLAVLICARTEVRLNAQTIKIRRIHTQPRRLAIPRFCRAIRFEGTTTQAAAVRWLLHLP